MNLFIQEKARMRLAIFRTLDWATIVAIGAIAGVHALVRSLYLMPRGGWLLHHFDIEKPSIVVVFESVSNIRPSVGGYLRY